MAIDPSAFFALQNQVQTENRLRDQSDTRLSNSFMNLTSIIMRLTQEMGMMTSIVSTGQQQESSVIKSLIGDQELISKGVFGKTAQSEMGGEVIGAAGGKGMGDISSLLGGGLIAGGLAGILGSVLGGPGGEPGAEPGSVPAGSLGTEKLVSLAQSAGFKGEDAATMAAIAMAESGGKSGAINDNPKTGDLSYGLWQINMIGKLGPARRKEFGIESNEQLLDPATNANAAKKVKDSSGFGAWSVYKSGKYKDYLPAAQEALKKSQSSSKSTSASQSTSKPSGSVSALGSSGGGSSSIASAPGSSMSDGSSSDPTKVINVANVESKIKPSSTSSIAQVTEPPAETSQGMIAAVPALTSEQNPVNPVRGSSQTTGDPFSGNPLSTISALSMGIQVG